VGYFFEGLIKVTFFDNAAVAMIVAGLLVVATLGVRTDVRCPVSCPAGMDRSLRIT
jgi:hypothetical protein